MDNKIKIVRSVAKKNKDNKRDTFHVFSIMSISEVAEIWGKDRAVLYSVITKGGKFLNGVDWRKSGNTIMVTVESMMRIYGDPENQRELKSGLMTEDDIEELGIMKNLQGDIG